jgi:hypothetical protein
MSFGPCLGENDGIASRAFASSRNHKFCQTGDFIWRDLEFVLAGLAHDVDGVQQLNVPRVRQ